MDIDIKLSVAVVGVCTRCGSVAVDDGISIKMVKSVTWLRRHGFSATVRDGNTKLWCCDACCAHHRRADYCVCGSGKHYRKCQCRSGTPIYELCKPAPKVRWVR